MAKKQRVTFAKREKERKRLAKQQAKRARRHATPDPNDVALPEIPAPSFGLEHSEPDPGSETAGEASPGTEQD